MRRLPKLILAKDLTMLRGDARPLSVDARAGKLVRIRHGVYVDARQWQKLESWERYALNVEAAAECLAAPTIFSHHSAASIHGIPTILRQQPVHALTTYAGGGRSRAGVRRHLVVEGSEQVQEVNGFLVTDRVRTVLDIAASVPFAEAVVPVDFLLNRNRNSQPVTKEQLLDGIKGTYSKAADRRVTAAVEFGAGDSGSPGESYARALIHVLGFEVPLLQYAVKTMRGTVYTDYYWKSVGLVGEFDGREKYMKPEYLKGRTPSQVVIEEKAREDAIRATGRRVFRLVWSDLSVSKLERALEAAGVPRRRRASAGHPNS
ncbi:hypothetical protein LRQ04_01615 [Paenarthrobacter sp. AR 02]|uniref:hypothetical protein n=1 Tax=Paenarthrobacter sp. AR 02 TaxID=2899821 RepID=UPI001F32601A|nr:hypothetical protein [Paenarthrobacter sp. AR 02]MCF3137939.1 hypothetical protein [Paenarthrobacter sp. AR 02]